MADYSFLTVWNIPAPLPEVWEAIYHSERWPEWWRGLLRVVELKPGDRQGLGSIRRFTWKGALPYTLDVDMRVTRIESPTMIPPPSTMPQASSANRRAAPLRGAALGGGMIESQAQGELVGIGRWHLVPKGRRTEVLYEWKVRTTKPWMNLLAPIARPLFAWNHDVVMRGGEQGLKRFLEEASDLTQEGLLEDSNRQDAKH